MSAPPEVVFNTAIDPSRVSGWLPEPLRRGDQTQPANGRQPLRARWETVGPPGWSAELRVEPNPAGGATAHLDLTADEPDQNLTELARSSLAGLARQVADNLTAG